jgi:hypothetical protein
MVNAHCDQDGGSTGSGFLSWTVSILPQTPPNFLFLVPVQSVIGLSTAALTSDQEAIVHQLAQGRLDITNRVANCLLQEPPFCDAFHGVLGLRMPHDIAEHLIS